MTNQISDDEFETLKTYRLSLMSGEQKAQEDYDRTLLALSGGALGISFAFVKDIVGGKPIQDIYYLLFAWIAWGVSVSCVLLSFYLSHKSFLVAISKVYDVYKKGDRKSFDNLYAQNLGGIYSSITNCLNFSGGLLFLLGVVFMVIFAFINLR